MKLEIAVLSKTGSRAVNEDACDFWSSPSIGVCVLADGAGGHGGGDVASKLVVQEILDWFREKTECSAEAIRAALKYANDAVVRKQPSGRGLADMRATAVVLAIDFDRSLAAWGHLGDSRLYCFRSRHIVVQTRDHSVVQSMVDAGYLQPDQLRSSPGRSQLLKAMGDSEECEPSVEPELFRVEANDKFLMCTDGLWECIEEGELEQTLEQVASADDWLRTLEARVLAKGQPRQDNYSAVAVWCKPETESAAIERNGVTLLKLK